MVIRLDENYNAMTSTALLGYVGETNARPVSIEGLTVDGADRYVLTIDYGDGVQYEVDITGGQWTPTADILRSAQTLSCQICAKKLSGQEYILLKKSRIFRLRIGAAIGDTAIPSPDVAMDALDRIDAIGRQAHADMQTAVTAAETATTAAENAKKSATNAGLSADTATQAANRAETAKTAAETSATQAETAKQGAENARQQAVTAQNAAKISAAQASVSAQQTEADKTITAGYAKTAKTNADSTMADRQAVQTLAEQVTADRATVAENAAQVATDRKAAETAAQTAQAVADSLPDDYTTAVGKIAENTAEINHTNTEVSELKGDLAANTTNINKNKNDIATNAGNITKNANDIKTLQEDLSSVGQQADANSKNIENLRNDVSRKFFESGLGIMRTGKVYGVKIWKSASNNSQTLEKTRDNAGLVCVPSTDTTVGQDDYADIPMFQWMKCNYKRYDDGFAYPIAVEGDGLYMDTGDVDIGSMMATFYYAFIDNEEYKELVISDTPHEELSLKPWGQAVRADGTVMPYFINSCYHSVTGTDGLLHSMKGKIARNQSHNNMITNYQKKGAGYWGAGSDRYTFAQIMMFIKYGTKSTQKVMAGVTNHYVQIKASIQSEEANAYFPVTNSQASSILVGTRFSVGYGTFNSSGKIDIDRSNGTIHAYADDVVVTAKVPMDDGVNTAIYLNCTAFNTMPITDSNGYTSDIYLTSMHAWSGDTDSVIGHHDGSPASNTDGKHPCRIQGIEFMLGGYTAASDTVMFFESDYSKDVYVAPRGVAHSASDSTIQSTYTLVGNIPANNGSDFWIGDVNHVNGVWYPSTVVSSDQYGMGDRCYAGGQATSGSREYLQGGTLWHGSRAGLSCLLCGGGLTGAHWYCLSAD